MYMSTSSSTPLGWSLNKAAIDNPNKQFRTEGRFQFCRINILFALTKEQIKFFTPTSDLAQSLVVLTLVLFSWNTIPEFQYLLSSWLKDSPRICAPERIQKRFRKNKVSAAGGKVLKHHKISSWDPIWHLCWVIFRFNVWRKKMFCCNTANTRTMHFNQLEKLEAAKAAWLVCLSLLSLTGPYWALLGFSGPY